MKENREEQVDGREANNRDGEMEVAFAAMDTWEEEGPLEGDQYDNDYPAEIYDKYDYTSGEEGL